MSGTISSYFSSFGKQYFPRKSLLLLLACFLLVTFLYNYTHIYRFGPLGPHMWRQSDCVSMAINYYKENRPFLSPELHACSPKGTYITISEFPILNYTAAKLWSVFGYHPGWYRLLHHLFLLLGMFSVFRVSEGLLRHSWWGGLITLLFFSSPLLGFYGFSFIADVPALCLSLFGAYLLYKYHRFAKLRHLYFAVPVFTLAALLKVTALFIPLLIAGVFVLQQLRIIGRKQQKLFKRPAHFFSAILLVLIFAAFWYRYASRFNSEHSAGLFLVGILPVWELSDADALKIMRSLIHNLLPEYYYRPGLVLMGFAVLWMFLNPKKSGAIKLVFIISALSIVLVYLVLFFQVFDVHDYYLINMLPLIFVLMLSFFLYMRANNRTVFLNRKIFFVFSVLVLLQLWNSAVRTRLKFSASNPAVKNSVFVDNTEYGWYDYLSWANGRTLDVCDEAGPWLRKKGIERNTPVICFPDASINIALAKMDQKGYTDNAYGHLTDRGLRMKAFTGYGAQYLILLDKTIANDTLVKPWTNYPVDSLKNLYLYDLRPYADSVKGNDK
jgi:hypothetical protein